MIQRFFIAINECRATERGTILTETDGEGVGQVDSLRVPSIGTAPFGQLARITVTARTSLGKTVEIERMIKLGGTLRTKGVHILSGYPAATYALRVPTSLWVYFLRTVLWRR
ncbi:MAG: hypothetical protein JXQ99_02520 [Hyphomicrobiaceae bacterium]